MTVFKYAHTASKGDARSVNFQQLKPYILSNQELYDFRYENDKKTCNI
jgi:hypothetical protein